MHEKRIYLNRIKRNTEYFYTSVETKVKKQVRHNLMLKERLQSSEEQESLHAYKCLAPQYIEGSGRVEKFSSIICMNKTESKYYVYG